MREPLLDRIGYNDAGEIRGIWKVAVLAVCAGLPLLYVLVSDGDDGERLSAGPADISALSGDSAGRFDDGDEPVVAWSPTLPSLATTTPSTSTPSTSTTSTSTTSTSTTTTSPPPPPSLPAADPAAPPVEPIGTYREGKLVLRGSVPSPELAVGFQRRMSTVIGPENVTNEMTLDPRVAGTSLTIDIDERFQFPEGSVIYDQEFEALLTLGAFALRLLPESTLVVTGHTDSVGDEATNQALSVARAALVADFMVRGGIPEGRVVARGAGESEPIADNATPEGRQANRRIEAKLEGIAPA